MYRKLYSVETVPEILRDAPKLRIECQLATLNQLDRQPIHPEWE